MQIERNHGRAGDRTPYGRLKAVPHGYWLTVLSKAPLGVTVMHERMGFRSLGGCRTLADVFLLSRVAVSIRNRDVSCVH